MIPWEKCAAEAIYTHVDDTGALSSFATDRINRWLATCKHPPARVPINRAQAESFVAEKAIDPHRVARITVRDLRLYPLVFASLPDGTHLLLDGRHRYLKAVALGRTHVRGIFLNPTEYTPFMVSLPNTLADAATLKLRLMQTPSGL